MMSLHETLEIVLQQMGLGEGRAVCKDDLRFRCQEISGQYPPLNEFNKVFESFRYPVNKYNLVYKAGVGWYRVAGSWGINQYKDRLNRQIIKREQLKQAFR